MILFYLRTHFSDPANQGVVDKYRGMAAALERSGKRADLVFFGAQGLHLNDQPLQHLPFRTGKGSLGHILLFFFWADRLLLQHIDFSTCDTVLIRHFPLHFGFMRLLKRLRKRYPKLRILLEIPTWPYDAEFSGWRRSLLLPLDRLLRSRLAGLVDRVLHYGAEPEIWGIPAVMLQNGIDPAAFPAILPARPATQAEALRLVAIGNWSDWHGLDRLLRAMPQLPGAMLRIIGAGKALAGYRNLINALGLEKQVVILSPLNGTALAEQLAWADIGIGTLGLHRKGVALNQSLKHRMYALAGLPFIYSAPDPAFPPDFPFALLLPSDDEPVDLQAVSAFFRNLEHAHPDFRQALRSFALQNLTWDRIIPRLAALNASSKS